MKILSRKNFMMQPAGILYRKNPKENGWDAYGEIEIKGDDPSDLPDFVCIDFGMLNDTHIDEMEVLEQSFPLQTDWYGRDGCFEREAVFLVYETWDLEQMRKQIDRAIEVAPKQAFEEPWKKEGSMIQIEMTSVYE